jgi:hypothetical protein
MNYKFKGINCTKKEEEQVETPIKKAQYMAICFLNGFLFPITIPYQIYKKLKGGKR